MKEIGSEYWLEDIDSEDSKPFLWNNWGNDYKLLVSGRSAINYVLNDLDKEIKIVYMPSYCCMSILQPFLDRNIKVFFYEVLINKEGIEYIIDFSIDCDIFFAISYFGFSSSTMDNHIKRFVEKGVFVIEDISHRLLSEKTHSEDSDYLIASIRKWFPIISGGLVIKKEGNLINRDLKKMPDDIINIKYRAMLKKRIFIFNEKDEKKEEILEDFVYFNKYINNNYKDIKIDEISLNIIKKINLDGIIKRRRLNGSYLCKSLEKLEKTKLLFKMQEGDCPLFIPIILNNNRDIIKQKLIDNRIYCPVHWKMPNLIENTVEKIKQIYHNELSLICDHRYGIKEMERIVSIIGENDNE